MKLRRPTQQEKVWFYERLLERLCVAHRLGDTQMVKQLLDGIGEWGRAHDNQYGQLSDAEVKKKVTQAFWKYIYHG